MLLHLLHPIIFQTSATPVYPPRAGAFENAPIVVEFVVVLMLRLGGTCEVVPVPWADAAGKVVGSLTVPLRMAIPVAHMHYKSR